MRTGRNLHCAGPNVRHNFSPILKKYFLLPTISVFRMFVGSTIFVPMFGLLRYPINRAEAPISIIACPHRDRVIINRESYSVTFLTDQSACSLQHHESWLSAVWWSLSVVAERARYQRSVL